MSIMSSSVWSEGRTGSVPTVALIDDVYNEIMLQVAASTSYSMADD